MARRLVERVRKILAYTRRAYRRRTAVPLLAERALTVWSRSRTRARRGARAGVDPERLELEQQLLAVTRRAAVLGSLSCSSTPGLRPSWLQAEIQRPERLLVAQPFTPVYLLPLVRLCAGERVEPEMLARATEIYRMTRMHPLAVRKEVEGVIADRQLESRLREALWLVHEYPDAVQQTDDAVQYFFGLRSQLASISPAAQLCARSRCSTATEQSSHLCSSSGVVRGSGTARLTARRKASMNSRTSTSFVYGHFSSGCCATAFPAHPEPRPAQHPNATDALSDRIDHNSRLSESPALRHRHRHYLRCIRVDGEYRSKFRQVTTRSRGVCPIFGNSAPRPLPGIHASPPRRRQAPSALHVLTREADEGRTTPPSRYCATPMAAADLCLISCNRVLRGCTICRAI
ncbi:hypothetical protein GWE18_40650 [Bradyrhizobium sp. CSA112]|nr:hypothetical protein [Bradyrhizobium sp. CSA112]